MSRDERTNENAIHEPRLAAVEQTMKKMMEECDKLYEVDRKKDRLDHAEEIRRKRRKKRKQRPKKM